MKMEADTKVIKLIISATAKEHFITEMEDTIKADGERIWCMASDPYIMTIKN